MTDPFTTGGGVRVRTKSLRTRECCWPSVERDLVAAL